jgi:hypothetical protein
MIQTLPALSNFLADWYEVAPGELALPVGNVPAQINPVLREFYCSVGALAERATAFRHPDNILGPFGAQDTILPVEELDEHAEPMIFLVENQGNWVAAASSNSPYTLIKGDFAVTEFEDDFEETQIPLVETLCGAALMETVMSVFEHMPWIETEEHSALCAEVSLGKSWSLQSVSVVRLLFSLPVSSSDSDGQHQSRNGSQDAACGGCRR